MPGAIRRTWKKQNQLVPPLKLLLCLAFIPAATQLAFAFGPEDALAVEPAAYLSAAARLELADLQESLAVLNPSGWLQLDYGKDWSYRAGIGLNLDPVRRLEAELNAARTAAMARSQKRAAVYQALSLHARLWQARADLESARLNIEIARLNLEAVTAHGGGELAQEDARLAIEEARLKLSMAQNQLDSSLAEAKLLGLEGGAEPGIVEFELPPAKPAAGPQIEYRLLEARRDRSWRGLFAIRTAATYTGGDRDYRFELRTADPRFDVSLGPKFPFSQSGEWRFSLSARLTLDPQAWAQTRQGQLAIEEKRARNEFDRARRQMRLDFWRRQVDLASENMKLARKRLELAGRRLQQARMRLSSGLISQLEGKRFELEERRAESRLAMAWAAYLRAVDGYLETADREWRIK